MSFGRCFYADSYRRLLPALLLCACLAGCAGGTVPAAVPAQTDTPWPTFTLATQRAATPVPTSSAPPQATRTPTATRIPLPTPTSTRTPVPTWTPTPDLRRRVVAFVSDREGDDDVYLLDLETGTVVNLTHARGEDREPALAADGRTLAFRSNREGRWAFYQIDLATGEQSPIEDDWPAAGFRGEFSWGAPGYRYAYSGYADENLDLYVCTSAGTHLRLTEHAAGDVSPAWRPGDGPQGPQIAFVSWREGQQDLYLIDVEGQELRRLTSSVDDERDPAWHPDGQRLVYVRGQHGAADLWELDLGTGTQTRLTADPYPDSAPAYAPDGTLVWTRYAPGEPFELHDPRAPGRWQLWMRAPGGAEQLVPLPVADMDVYTPAAGYALWPPGTAPLALAPTPAPTAADELAGLTRLDIACAGGDPRINAHLVAAYDAWRAEVLAQSGYDVLGNISDMFRPLGYGTRNYGTLSWHRTGRALDLLFEWHDPPDGPNRLAVVREDLGEQTYWRLYLLCREQDGRMGEPLTAAPWVFWFDLDPAKEAAAYAQGGRPGEIPAGYYVDLTRLAGRHGWHRIASYEQPDFDWRTDSVGREFWHYQRTDGLTWWQAMGEIYAPDELERTYGWTVCVDKLGLEPAWLEAKGIPTPSPIPTLTPTHHSG